MAEYTELSDAGETTRSETAMQPPTSPASEAQSSAQRVVARMVEPLPQQALNLPVPVAPTQVIVPPVNVSIPPELVGVFQAQMQASLDTVLQGVVAQGEKTLQAIVETLPAQEAAAVKKAPWLIPMLDVLIGVAALGILIYFIVASVGYNNAQAKQYLGAVGMIVLALMNRSPISPPPTPQTLAKQG